ncbi:MAG: YkgJ family cysteine cluster protein [Clostridiales bacterium]|nr:YkgJ family cysteine cluster protein [Clostridiales bacterium]MCF8022123.1 YkgJ family cysteine cluster protein [Clostridiales bacterium]
MNKVNINIVKFKGKTGYDVKVRDVHAAVQDYLDALNYAIDYSPVDRLRAPGRNTCAGCDLCCRERAPLTWIDVLNLRKLLESDDAAFDIQRILKKIAYISVDGPVVDIILLRRKDNKCIFLDRESSLCSIYKYRPMVCQLYICSPATQRAKRLWEVIVNTGEDELVRNWLLHIQRTGQKMLFNEGCKPCPRLDDYKPTVFKGKNSYKDILIKDVCPPKLWKALLGN